MGSAYAPFRSDVLDPSCSVPLKSPLEGEQLATPFTNFRYSTSPPVVCVVCGVCIWSLWREWPFWGVLERPIYFERLSGPQADMRQKVADFLMKLILWFEKRKRFFLNNIILHLLRHLFPLFILKDNILKVPLILELSWGAIWENWWRICPCVNLRLRRPDCFSFESPRQSSNHLVIENQSSAEKEGCKVGCY